MEDEKKAPENQDQPGTNGNENHDKDDSNAPDPNNQSPQNEDVSDPEEELKQLKMKVACDEIIRANGFYEEIYKIIPIQDPEQFKKKIDCLVDLFNEMTAPGIYTSSERKRKTAFCEAQEKLRREKEREKEEDDLYPDPFRNYDHIPRKAKKPTRR